MKDHILDHLNKLREEVQEHFESYNIFLSDAFSIIECAIMISETPEVTTTLLCNLEDEGIMTEISHGNYEHFDIYDSSIFNDGYEDMMDQLKEDLM